MDALFQKVDPLQPTSSPSGSSSGVHGHTTSECRLGQLPRDLTVEQANSLDNYNARPSNDPYSTTYNPRWRNHPNFSYKAPNPPPHHPSQGHLNPPDFQYRAPPQYQLAPPSLQKSNLESLMERFIQTKTKTNEALGESVSQLNSKFEGLSTHQKMMETQLTQIA